MSALKPCPFCGNDGTGPIEDALQVHHNEPDYVHDHRHTWTVQCDKCTATMGYSDSEDEAVEAWNRRPEPFAPSPAGVEVVAWQWRKKPWAGSADGSAKWSDWQNGRAADAAKFEPADYEERALVPAASLDQATRRAEEAARREAAWEETRLANANLRNENGALRGRCSALEQALEDEREACAKIAETLPFTAEHHPTRIAKAIRAREALSSTASSITEKETPDA